MVVKIQKVVTYTITSYYTYISIDFTDHVVLDVKKMHLSQTKH